MKYLKAFSCIVILSMVVKVLLYWMCTSLDVVWQDHSISIEASKSRNTYLQHYEYEDDYVLERLMTVEGLSLNEIFIERNFDPNCSLIYCKGQIDLHDNYTVILPIEAETINTYKGIRINLINSTDTLKLNGNTTLKTTWYRKLEIDDIHNAKLEVINTVKKRKYELNFQEY